MKKILWYKMYYFEPIIIARIFTEENTAHKQNIICMSYACS